MYFLIETEEHGGSVLSVSVFDTADAAVSRALATAKEVGCPLPEDRVRYLLQNGGSYRDSGVRTTVIRATSP